MYRVLLKANKAVKRAIEKGAIVLADRVLRRLMTLYDGIVSLGLAFHEQQPPLIKRPGARGRQARRPGHNLLIRLRNFKDDVLRFASNFAVPFTNNQAEQDIRMMKVKMKISGGFRSQAGAEAFAALRSVISTARKQRWDILKPYHPRRIPLSLHCLLKNGLGSYNKQSLTTAVDHEVRHKLLDRSNCTKSQHSLYGFCSIPTPIFAILQPPIQHLRIKDIVLLNQFIGKRLYHSRQSFWGGSFVSAQERKSNKQCQLRCKWHWYGKHT